MQDGEIQQELLKETRTAKKALELAINIKMGIQNQLNESGASACSVSKKLANASVNSNQNSWNRPRTTTNKFKPTVCPKC